MEQRPGPWIAALRHSHDRLSGLVESLDAAALSGPSYASEWTIAQVLSHMGSQAEIFGRFLDAARGVGEAPGRDDFPPIWDSWNAKGPAEQAVDALATDGALVARIEALDAGALADLHLTMFGMDLDAVGFVRIAVGEHALHTWDVAVALDPTATVAPDAAALLIDGLDQLVAHTGKPGGPHRVVRVTTMEPARDLVLELGDVVTLNPAVGATDGGPELLLPAEALIRLVYGRLDPEHTAGVVVTDIDLADLAAVFPGF